MADFEKMTNNLQKDLIADLVFIPAKDPTSVTVHSERFVKSVSRISAENGENGAGINGGNSCTEKIYIGRSHLCTRQSPTSIATALDFKH